MTDRALALADQARRTSLLAVIWTRRKVLTIEQLDHLLHRSPYARELAAITVGELLDPSRPKPPPLIHEGESVEDAVMRVFKGRQTHWLTSGFFTRHMGLRRWTAQKVLADLAQQGLLERKGTTSGTRYRLRRSQAPARLRPLLLHKQ